MVSVHMKRGEMPKQPTVRTGCYFVSEERFNNSVTTLVSIEYNQNLCIVFLVTKWLLHLLVLYSRAVSMSANTLVDDLVS